jgi:hypothetical protein
VEHIPLISLLSWSRPVVSRRQTTVKVSTLRPTRERGEEARGLAIGVLACTAHTTTAHQPSHTTRGGKGGYMGYTPWDQRCGWTQRYAL